MKATVNVELFLYYLVKSWVIINNGTDCRRGKVICQLEINLLPESELVWKTVGEG